jgi:predicted nucleic-acid-binding protein
VIGLDTNVLVRFLTEDEPLQFAEARQWIQEASNRGEKLYVSSVVLCELVWTLSRSYTISKDGILEIVEELLSTGGVDVEDFEATWNALQDYAVSSAGFADCLIRRKALAAGCSELRTFDQKLLEAALV